MKKFDVKSVILGLIIGTIGITTAFAASGIKSATYSNAKVTLDDVSIPLNNSLVAIVQEGEEDARLYMPLRELLEHIGYDVNWDSKLNTVNLISNNMQAENTTMKTAIIKDETWYLVETEQHLRVIGTGTYGLDKNYMQNTDIQVSSTEWTPIGTHETPFTGKYNGNGFEIKGLTMTDPDAKIIGLFGVAKKATICNITLRDYDILSAGRNATGITIAPILAFGYECDSYDNMLYPKK